MKIAGDPSGERRAGGSSDRLEPTVHRPDHPLETYSEVESLGVSLGPALHEACGDRLGNIEWFRSAWQRSGAATGRTFWRLPSGEVIEAIVKVPVGYREYYWTSRIGETDPMQWIADEARTLPIPRMLASGTELGGYDMAWLVLERLPGRTIASELNAHTFGLMFESVSRFYTLASELRKPETHDRPTAPAWERLIRKGMTSLVDNSVADADAWCRVLGRVLDRLDAIIDEWATRPIDTWCHGDLHPGNVMLRPCSGDGTERCAVLLDLGLTHAGCWIEDAIYLERQHWGREEMLCGVDPVAGLARARREQGLEVDLACERFADLRRVLMAATSPAFLDQEGGSRYLEAARAVLERVDL